MAPTLWAGLDVGVESTAVCIIDDAGEVLYEGTCSTNVKSIHREIAFLKRRRSARVALESGSSMSLARGLRNLGYKIDIYEARRLSKFLSINRNKTDAGDARGIANAGRIGASLVSKVHIKTLECQCLAARLAIRRRLIQVRIQIVNLLGRQLEQFGGRLAHCGASQLRNRTNAQIKLVFGRTNNVIVRDFRDLLRRSEELLAYQKQLDRELAQLALENDVSRRLMEIPGVGPICALTFYACVGDPDRFRRASDIGPYFGMTPRLLESGLSKRIGRITKFGSRPMRGLLLQAAIVFMRCSNSNDALHAWTLGIERRRGRGKSRVALGRKLATIMLAMWKGGTRYRPRQSEGFA